MSFIWIALESVSFTQVLWNNTGTILIYPCHAVVVAMQASNGHQRFFVGHTEKVCFYIVGSSQSTNAGLEIQFFVTNKFNNDIQQYRPIEMKLSQFNALPISPGSQFLLCSSCSLEWSTKQFMPLFSNSFYIFICISYAASFLPSAYISTELTLGASSGQIMSYVIYFVSYIYHLKPRDLLNLLFDMFHRVSVLSLHTRSLYIPHPCRNSARLR